MIEILQVPLLKILKQPENVIIKPHALLLVLSMKRGALREKGAHGRFITRVYQLLHSPQRMNSSATASSRSSVPPRSQDISSQSW